MIGPSLFLAALIPMLVGFAWYHPKVMGTAWANEAGLTQEKLKTGNMPLMLGLTYLFSLLLAFTLQFMVVHQYSAASLAATPPYDTEANKALLQPILTAFEDNYRTFKHGALHGFMGGVCLGLGIMGINSVFERRSARYIIIHLVYIVLTMTLMGGIICAWH